MFMIHDVTSLFHELRFKQLNLETIFYYFTYWIGFHCHCHCFKFKLVSEQPWIRMIIDEAMCIFVFEHEYMDEKIIVKAVRDLDVYLTFTKEEQRQFHMDVMARVSTAFDTMKFVFWDRSMKFEDSCKYGDVSNQLLLQLRSEGYLTKNEITKSYQKRWALHNDLLWSNRRFTIAYKARLILGQQRQEGRDQAMRRHRHEARHRNQNGPYGNDQNDSNHGNQEHNDRNDRDDDENDAETCS